MQKKKILIIIKMLLKNELSLTGIRFYQTLNGGKK